MITLACTLEQAPLFPFTYFEHSFMVLVFYPNLPNLVSASSAPVIRLVREWPSRPNLQNTNTATRSMRILWP